MLLSSDHVNFVAHPVSSHLSTLESWSTFPPALHTTSSTSPTTASWSSLPHASSLTTGVSSSPMTIVASSSPIDSLASTSTYLSHPVELGVPINEAPPSYTGTSSSLELCRQSFMSINKFNASFYPSILFAYQHQPSPLDLMENSESSSLSLGTEGTRNISLEDSGESDQAREGSTGTGETEDRNDSEGQ